MKPVTRMSPEPLLGAINELAAREGGGTIPSDLTDRLRLRLTKHQKQMAYEKSRGMVIGAATGATLISALPGKKFKFRVPFRKKKMKVRQGKSGLLGGALVGYGISGNKKLEFARGLVHSYILEHRPDLLEKEKPAVMQFEHLPGKEFFAFARQREEDPFGFMKTSPGGVIQGTKAAFKKSNADIRKQIRTARKGAELAGDLYDVAKKKGTGAAISKGLDRAKGKETVDGSFRVGRETRSSVRVYHGKKPRERRKKYWWEKKVNRDRMAAGAVSGALITGAAAQRGWEHSTQRAAAKAIHKAGLAPAEVGLKPIEYTTKGKLGMGEVPLTNKDIAKEFAQKPGRAVRAWNIRRMRGQLRGTLSKATDDTMVSRGGKVPTGVVFHKIDDDALGGGRKYKARIKERAEALTKKFPKAYPDMASAEKAAEQSYKSAHRLANRQSMVGNYSTAIKGKELDDAYRNLQQRGGIGKAGKPARKGLRVAGITIRNPKAAKPSQPGRGFMRRKASSILSKEFVMDEASPFRKVQRGKKSKLPPPLRGAVETSVKDELRHSGQTANKKILGRLKINLTDRQRVARSMATSLLGIAARRKLPSKMANIIPMTKYGT